MSALNRFLGDSPLRVLLKLVVASFLVGVVMSYMGWSPFDVLYAIRDGIVSLWETGFDALYRFWAYFLLGAAIVIPAFLVLRLLSWRR